MTPETRLRNAVVRRLQRLKDSGAPVKWIKLPVIQGVEIGTPDLLIVYRGLAHMIELKAGRNGATVIQQRRMKEWATAGAVCGVARSVEDVLGLLGVAGVTVATADQT